MKLDSLIQWFLKQRASLPWRPEDPHAKRDPYAVWISEVMLQQTQVETVRKHYIAWLRDFPSVDDLAQADEENVLLHWQGLGYYSRAKNLHKAAKILIEKYNGVFPKTRLEIEALPGIGKYTAGAILSMARHESEPILDGNLIRIFSRLHRWNFLPTSKPEQDIYWNEARTWSQGENAYIINEALMEMGRTLCKPQNPLCPDCPLHKKCKAASEHCTSQYPPRKKSIQETWHGVIVIIESADGKIFSVQEEDTPFLKGQRGLPLFEFSKAHGQGFPGKAERWITPESIEEYHWCGAIKHAITKYKIECQVLYIRSKDKSKKSAHWIARANIKQAFANSLNLKALHKALED